MLIGYFSLSFLMEHVATRINLIDEWRIKEEENFCYLLEIKLILRKWNFSEQENADTYG